MTTESRKECWVAAFFEEVVVVDGEVDVGREDCKKDEDNVGGTESEMVPESNVVEIELGCAVRSEDGTGIEEVNSGTGLWNEPLIPSSLNWRLSKFTRKTSRISRTRNWKRMLLMGERDLVSLSR